MQDLPRCGRRLQVPACGCRAGMPRPATPQGRQRGICSRSLTRERPFPGIEGSFGPTAGTAGAHSRGAQAQPRYPRGIHVASGQSLAGSGFLPPPPPPWPRAFPLFFRQPRGRRLPSCSIPRCRPVSCPLGLPKPLSLLPSPTSIPRTSPLPCTERSQFPPPCRHRSSSLFLFPDPRMGGPGPVSPTAPPGTLCPPWGLLRGTWPPWCCRSDPAQLGDFRGSAFHQPFSSSSAIKVSNAASLPQGAAIPRLQSLLGIYR